MERLANIRVNVSFAKAKEKDKGEYIPVYELIFLIDRAEYSFSNEGEILRNRVVDQKRFSTTTEGLKAIIEVCQDLLDKGPDALIPETAL